MSVFTKNREQLMRGEVSGRFLDIVLGQAREKQLLSEEHFTFMGGVTLEVLAQL